MGRSYRIKGVVNKQPNAMFGTCLDPNLKKPAINSI